MIESSNVRPAQAAAQPNSLDAITDFGGAQPEDMAEQTRVKRPGEESAAGNGPSQISF
ncbi:hypothetical protein ACJ6YJ_26565 [Pseudomonas marginalis]|jgi:hypothetical protein|uniref:hypothetical protein n=1 Tax=Pseudomonas TaxID=286 RepID=UPI0008E44738|nr:MULTISPECIES: hypothetical protein [Pseudomonas]SFS26899.1 hypothetical protein SAMN03159318_03184 [Pseudomonas sp. NFACC42-2]